MIARYPKQRRIIINDRFSRRMKRTSSDVFSVSFDARPRRKLQGEFRYLVYVLFVCCRRTILMHERIGFNVRVTTIRPIFVLNHVWQIVVKITITNRRQLDGHSRNYRKSSLAWYLFFFNGNFAQELDELSRRTHTSERSVACIIVTTIFKQL